MTYISSYSSPHSSSISISSIESLGVSSKIIVTGANQSTAWPSANRAFFVPFVLRRTVIVNKLFICNGGTAAGNFDIGIYTPDGTRIISTGSTAQSGTNTTQVVSVTNTTIGPGVFYIATALNGTTGTAISNSAITVTLCQCLGIFSMNSAFPLPSTATFASVASARLPFSGFNIIAV